MTLEAADRDEDQLVFSVNSPYLFIPDEAVGNVHIRQSPNYEVGYYIINLRMVGVNSKL